MNQTQSFDTWTSIFLLAVAMGLFLFVLLLTNKNRKNLPIAFLILAFSIILFQYVLYWTRFELSFGYLMLLPAVCYYVTGPLLYRYVLNLYDASPQPQFALHFIPAALLLIPNFGMWFKYLGWLEGPIPMLWLAQKPWFIAVHMFAYAMLVLFVIQQHKSIDSQYKRLRHRWANVLNTLYLIFIGAYAAYYILVNFEFFNSQWDYMISLTMSISIYAIGFFIFKQSEVFDGEFYAQLFHKPDPKNESLEQSMLNELYGKVTHYMNTNKPYTNNDLRLVHLADQLGFSTHLLSKVINEKAGMNFNQFINEYRLRDATALLEKEHHLTINNIYFDVGFNNKATFYSVFKRKHNCTPSQYRKQLSGS